MSDINDESEYDVVLDVLQKHYDKLWDMTKGYSDWGIMDYIRLEQMNEIKKAMALWKDHKKNVRTQ